MDLTWRKTCKTGDRALGRQNPGIVIAPPYKPIFKTLQINDFEKFRKTHKPVLDMSSS